MLGQLGESTTSGKMWLTKLTLWTLILALCCALAAAQEQVPLARVTTNFVEIHVVAQDKRATRFWV
jgi:hypothetical protein